MIARTWEGIQALRSSLLDGSTHANRALTLASIAAVAIKPHEPLIAAAPNASLAAGASPLVAAGALAGAAMRYLQVETPEKASRLGAAAATIHYGTYAAVTRQRFGATCHPVGLAARAAVVAGASVVASRVNPGIALATASGGSALALFGAVGNDPSIRRHNTRTRGLGHGVNMMFAVEGLSLLRGFGIESELIDATIAVGSATASLLIVDALEAA